VIFLFIVAVIKLECIGPVVVVETPWGREVEAVVSAEVEPEEIDPVLVEWELGIEEEIGIVEMELAEGEEPVG